MPWSEIAWRVALLVQMLRQLHHAPERALPYAALALFAAASLLLVFELSIVG